MKGSDYYQQQQQQQHQQEQQHGGGGKEHYNQSRTTVNKTKKINQSRKQIIKVKLLYSPAKKLEKDNLSVRFDDMDRLSDFLPDHDGANKNCFWCLVQIWSGKQRAVQCKKSDLTDTRLIRNLYVCTRHQAHSPEK